MKSVFKKYFLINIIPIITILALIVLTSNDMWFNLKQPLTTIWLVLGTTILCSICYSIYKCGHNIINTYKSSNLKFNVFEVFIALVESIISVITFFNFSPTFEQTIIILLLMCFGMTAIYFFSKIRCHVSGVCVGLVIVFTIIMFTNPSILSQYVE